VPYRTETAETEHEPYLALRGLDDLVVAAVEGSKLNLDLPQGERERLVQLLPCVQPFEQPQDRLKHALMLAFHRLKHLEPPIRGLE